MELSIVLDDFRNFLIRNYERLSLALLPEDMNDWLQANWEIIVESRLRRSGELSGLLDVYGDGADCNGASSRVSVPDGQPSNAIHIEPGYVLHSFGTMKNGYFVQGLPFDYVKGENPVQGDIVLKFDSAKLVVGMSYDSLIY